MADNKFEFSAEEKLELLSKWLKHYKIPRIVFEHQYRKPAEIGRMFSSDDCSFVFPNESNLSFESYCAAVQFFELVSLNNEDLWEE